MTTPTRTYPTNRRRPSPRPSPVEELVPDALWQRIAPLLPAHPAQPRGGRPWIDDRAALAGVIYALKTGTPWRLIRAELGFGSGVTCWRRLRDWQAAGVWERLHAVLLDELGQEEAIDWSRANVDSASARAKRGAR